LDSQRRCEEFRDDLRGTTADRASAQRARRLLPSERLGELTRLSAWRSSAAIDRWGVVEFHVGAPLVALVLGGAIALGRFLVLWTLPLLTVIQPILRLRAVCELGAVTKLTTSLTAARTNLAGPIARLVLFPHHVNYHVEHHLFPAVPH